MKKLSLLLCAMFIGSLLFSQQMATERMETMSLGSHNAFVLDLPEIDSRKAQDYWEDYFKEYSRLKNNRKADHHYAEGVEVSLISSKELDVYSKMEELSGSSRLIVWFDNQSAFISSEETPEEASNALQFLNDFAIAAEKRHVEELLAENEDVLKGLEKELKDLEKDKEKYEKNIEKAKEEIKENESNIEQNIVDQENKAADIDAQKSAIEKIKERLLSVGKQKSKM